MSFPAIDPLANQRLGDFAIVREIGRGGMGVVYEARQVSLNRKVALKVLSGGLGLTAKAVQRFHREAEAAAKLHHTNIVPVYATGEERGHHFYAMELIEGPSLDQVIRELSQAPAGATAQPTGSGDGDSGSARLALTGPYFERSATSTSGTGLSSSSLDSGGAYFDTVARMIAEVADALAYAHNNGVIHRDIKPSNLLLSPEGRLSINDFGLARLLEQPGMTMTGEFVGTPAYMSPEQITAGRVPVDHRTDIYSLGATLYELLSLRRPFAGERRDQVLAQILQKDPTPPRTLHKKIPVDLETICLKAMDKDPDRRYQTAAQMAEDLRRYVNRFAISARRAGPVERLKKWVQRHPALATALVVVAFAVGTAGFFAWQAHDAELRRVEDERRHAEALREQERKAALEKAMLAAMSGDLDRAEVELAAAERLDASTGQARLVRGLVALYRGDADAAVRVLREAVKAMPGSVAARALLGVAYFHQLDLVNLELTEREVYQLTPSTPEDTVFRALLMSITDPVHSKTLVDEPPSRRNSTGLARAVRAEVLCINAMFTGKVADANDAVEAAQRLSDVLPESPVALANTVTAYLVLASAHEAAGRHEDRDRAFTQAGAAADALKDPKFAKSAVACRARYSYYERRNLLKEAEEVCKQARSAVGGFQFDLLLAILLYRRGELEPARIILEGVKPTGSFPEIALCYVLTDLGKTPMVDEYFKESDKRFRTYMDRLYLYTAADFTGRPDVAGNGFKHLEPNQIANWQQGWYKHVLDYCLRDIDEKKLLGEVRSKGCECEAHYFIAMRHLGEGDPKGAKDHFEKAVATRVIVYYDYQFSRAFLDRMKLAEQTGEKWPHWIDSKK